MARRVVLHVGAMKSGTSYLQRLVAENRDLLGERGVLLPGETWRDQVRGVAEVLDRQKVVARPGEGAWQLLVDEVADWDGTGLISMEFLGPASPAKIDRVVSSFPEGSVEVVLTARDLGRNVPAMWQEALKNGRTWTFAEFVAGVADGSGDGPGPGTLFWREQGIARICRRWGKAVGADRVTVVTVPHAGADRGLLWQRFASVLGVEDTGVRQPGSGNESLGAASAEVVRQLNGMLADLDFSDYAPVVKHRLAKSILGERRDEEPTVGFEVPDWLRRRSADVVERLAEQEVRVVGDLAELDPVPTPGVAPGDVEPEEQLAAALAGLAGLVRSYPRGGG